MGYHNTHLKMAQSLLISLSITLVFMTLSVYGFDDDLEDFKLYDDISASEARTFNFSSIGDSLPDGRAILAFTLLGLLALVTFGPSLLGAFGVALEAAPTETTTEMDLITTMADTKDTDKTDLKTPINSTPEATLMIR